MDFERFQSSSHATWPVRYDHAAQQFSALLDRRVTEPKLQEFLETNPFLLPGFERLHHGPYCGIVATKFPLGTFFQTDFAFVGSNSQTLCLTCVEIESPRKRLFRKDGHFSRDYLDAKQQIVDWLFWAEHHVRDALNAWGYLMRHVTPKSFEICFQGYLVFGRRAELVDPLRQERWSSEASALDPRLSVMTYDRLLQRHECGTLGVDNDKIAVCNFKERRFHVKKVCV